MKNSIRFKITIWYSLTLFLILSVFSLFLYKKIEKVLYEHVDETLFLKGESLADGIVSFINDVEVSCDNIFNCDKRLSLFIEDIINYDIDKPSFTFISLAVLDLNGNVLYKSLNFPKNLKFPFNITEDIEKGKVLFETVFLDGEPYRAYFTDFKIKNSTYVVLSLRPLMTVYITLKTIKMNIILAIPLTVFLTAFLGVIMVKFTLKPVNNIIETVKQITEKNLSMRIKLPKTQDEIFKLAETFNKMIERVEKAFENQKELIQGLSHQIKTPLTIIKGEIDISLKKNRSSDEYKQTLLSISQEIERIKDLVENLLMISRLENMESYNKNSVSILKCIEKSISMLEKYVRIKNIKIIFEKKIDFDFFVFFDEYMVIRGFYNIIENAIKYSFENSQIIIRIYEDKDLIIDVEDFGIGISEEDSTNIFKRFYRGSNVFDETGFGLGLYLSKSLFERLNGNINLIRKDKGVIFRISFKKN